LAVALVFGGLAGFRLLRRLVVTVFRSDEPPPQEEDSGLEGDFLGEFEPESTAAEQERPATPVEEKQPEAEKSRQPPATAPSPDATRQAPEPAVVDVPETGERDRAPPVADETGRADGEVKPAPSTPKPPDPVAEARAKLTAFLDAVAGDLLRANFTAARERLAKARLDEDMESLKSEVIALSDLLAAMARTEKQIHQSFRKDIGKAINVRFKDGDKWLLIRTVGAREITGIKTSEDGRLTHGLRAKMTFTTAELSPAEKLGRIEPMTPRPETIIMRGLLHVQNGDLDLAETVLREAPGALGKALISGVRDLPE